MKHVLSYGGGADSFAMLVWAHQTSQQLDAVAFVDVGDPLHRDPAEWPGTYRHLVEQAAPLCRRMGVPLAVIDSKRYPVRDARSLFEWLRARHQIPVAGPNRICTRVAKVERFEAWMDDAFPGEQVEVWIGFEKGEESRAAKDPNAGTGRQPEPGQAVRVNRFPLIELDLCRCRCEALIRAAGFPVPRKSACVFCPYGSKGDWQTFARELPDQFAQVVQLEADKPPTEGNRIKLSIMGFRTLYRKVRGVDGRPVLRPDGKPLRVKIGHKAPPLPAFIQGEYKPQEKICSVCGQLRALKATGCGYQEAA